MADMTDSKSFALVDELSFANGLFMRFS